MAIILEFAKVFLFHKTNFFLRVRPNSYRNKIPKLLRKNGQESWQELGVKKQTHFLLVFSTINIGFYPQKHCNRQRHHNEVKGHRKSYFHIPYIFTIFFLIFHAMCSSGSHIVFQRYGTSFFMQKASLNLILGDIWSLNNQLLKLKNQRIFVFTWWKFWLLTGYYLLSSGKFLFTLCFFMWIFWCNVWCANILLSKIESLEKISGNRRGIKISALIWLETVFGPII